MFFYNWLKNMRVYHQSKTYFIDIKRIAFMRACT